MIRKRRLMRLWYLRRRNIKHFRLLLCSCSVILVFTMLWTYVLLILLPLGLSNFEEEVYENIQATVDEVTDKKGDTYKEYDELVETDKDLLGRIVSTKADNIKLSKLSFKLEEQMRNGLIFKGDGRFTAIKAALFPFSAVELHVGGAKVSDVQTNYVTRFSRKGEKETRLNILIDVCVTYDCFLGVRKRTYEFTLWDEVLDGMH